MFRTIAAACLALSVATPVLAGDGADPSLVARGKALVTAGDCAACHTASDGSSDFGGGEGIAAPMGQIIASNITPSKTHGIGDWTLAQFTAALRKGRSPDLGWLYPAMPYTSYTQLSDKDVQAIYSYLMLKVKPSDHAVPATDLPFPFYRPMMIGWNLLYLHDKRSPNADAAPGSAARGQYVADALEHCSTCHTPRNAMMAEESGKYLAGSPVGGWYAPNITSGKDGIGGWSDAELVQFLKTGSNAHAVAGGDMGVAIERSISKLPDDDIKALAAYIRKVPAVADADKVAAQSPDKVALNITDVEPDQQSKWSVMDDAGAVTDGARLYQSGCAACHGDRGQGSTDGAHPSLITNETVRSTLPNNLINVIDHGIDRKIGDAKYAQYAMPGFQHSMSTAQKAALVSYIRTTFAGERYGKVTTAQIEAVETGKTSAGWLIDNAATLAMVAIVVVVLIILALILLVVARRRRRTA